MQVDSRVVEDLQPVRLVAARRVGYTPACQHREQQGEDLDHDQPVPGDVHVSPTCEVTRAPHEVELLFGQRLDEIGQLRRIVLAV